MTTPRHLLRQTVTLRTPSGAGAPDEFGDPTAGTISTTVVLGYLFQRTRGEDTAGRTIQTEELGLILPPEAVVSGNSTAEVDGIVYELDGPPWPAFNPRTAEVEHIEATVRRTA